MRGLNSWNRDVWYTIVKRKLDKGHKGMSSCLGFYITSVFLEIGTLALQGAFFVVGFELLYLPPARHPGLIIRVAWVPLLPPLFYPLDSPLIALN